MATQMATFRDSDEHDEEHRQLRRVDSGKLAKHLYNRHKNEFWAYLNLTLSTLSMFLFGHSTHYPGLFSILFGIIGSELGQIPLLFQTLNLRRIYKYHPAVFYGTFGKVAMAVNVWSYGAILHNLWQALGARQLFSKALQEQKIFPRAGKSIGRWNYILSLIPLFIVSRRAKSLNIQRSIRYADMQQVDPNLLGVWKRTPSKLRNLHMLVFRGRVSQWLSLDVVKLEHMPSDRAPILVYYHGGAWLLGDKAFSGLSGASRVASRGVITVMVNYRMAPETIWPVMIQDCKRALIYVKKHAREWGGDPDRIFVSGESAGGHLSALMGCTANLKEFQPSEDPFADTSVAGALPIYGVYDMADTNGHLRTIRASLLDMKVGVRGYFARIVAQTPINPQNLHLFELASSAYHIRQALAGQQNPQIPPYFISHGTHDMLASYGDSKAFYDELQKVRARFGSWAPGESDVFVEVASGLHGFGYLPSPRSHALGDAMVDFMFHHMRRLDAAQQDR